MNKLNFIIIILVTIILGQYYQNDTHIVKPTIEVADTNCFETTNLYLYNGSTFEYSNICYDNYTNELEAKINLLTVDHQELPSSLYSPISTMITQISYKVLNNNLYLTFNTSEFLSYGTKDDLRKSFDDLNYDHIYFTIKDY